MVRKNLFMLFALVICAGVQAQDLNPYLSGLMARDAKILHSFYTQHFGFTVKDERDMPERGIRFYLLERDGYLLEIIQRNDIFDPKVILDTAKTKSYVRGYFKTGFYVTNIRQWYDTLKQNHVDIISEDVTRNEKYAFILVRDPEGNLIQLKQKPE
jgi:catechol 2,3-dioxygenase-like lactoylglutathione lyase family enzyme